MNNLRLLWNLLWMQIGSFPLFADEPFELIWFWTIREHILNLPANFFAMLEYFAIVSHFQPWYNGDPPYGLRGYLNDRVNRIIGYAIVRQIREKPGSCKPAKIVRSAITYCTGESGISNEETADFCAGWIPKTKNNMGKPECQSANEYTYRFVLILFNIETWSQADKRRCFVQGEFCSQIVSSRQQSRRSNLGQAQVEWNKQISFCLGCLRKQDSSVETSMIRPCQTA